MNVIEGHNVIMLIWVSCLNAVSYCAEVSLPEVGAWRLCAPDAAGFHEDF